MTTRYLFAYYTLDSQVSLSPSMSMKTGLFFFLTFCYIITSIFGIYYTSLLCYGNLKKKKKKKKREKIEQIKNNMPQKSGKLSQQQAQGQILVVIIKGRVYRCELQETRRLNYFFKILYSLFFIRTKILVLVKKFKNKLRTKPGLLFRRT